MSRTFILDDSTTPARFGAAASLWANRNALPLWSLRPAFAGDDADSHQHVCAAGYCVTSGLYRSDTLRHEVADPARLADSEPDAVILLALCDAGSIAGLPGRRLFSQTTASSLRLRDTAGATLLALAADDYGRWSPCPRRQAAFPALRLALVGREYDQRAVYPAIMAALGDAADLLHIALDIRFLPPATLAAEPNMLDDVSAVVLPGGASMAAVAGQIGVAHATFARSLPTLGLCLGMQSMATAVVQRQPGCAQAMMAEVDPAATLHTFTAFPDRRHRCGVLPFYPCGPLAGVVPAGVMHYNHRYRFTPALIPQLEAGGVVVSAATAGIVEAISHSGRPFWHGVQGHPELASRADAPHPLFSALLRAALSSPA